MQHVQYRTTITTRNGEYVKQFDDIQSAFDYWRGMLAISNNADWVIEKVTS